MVIYSVGHSTRDLEEFLKLLNLYGVRNLADVRRFPTSRFAHFTKEALERHLAGAMVAYVYLGHELGGYRRGGYEAYMNTQAFREGLGLLEKLARTGPTAFMCAEKLPWRCHRRFIARVLCSRGWKVIHIIDETRSIA